MFHFIRESRYLLVLTENYAALPIVQQELHKKGEEPVVIFGSSFPKDQEYTQVPTAVLKKIVLFLMKWMFRELHFFITKNKLSLQHRLLVGIK